MQKVLIANRGEIAVRVARACRDAGVARVAVYAEPDRDAPHVTGGDDAVALRGGSTPDESYLDMGKVLAIAAQAGADAVHPGYGFLSENAEFAQAVIDAGLVWVGPSPAAISAMGRMVKAKELAARARVPVLESVTVGNDLDDAARQVGELPLPVLVKPSAGGGGKGMQVVRTPDELRPALEQARREALSSFGDGTLFVERYLEHPRHVEVQLVADGDG